MAAVRSSCMPDAEDDPRVLYAADRTVLAAERTYAAWVRTGLVSLAAGVGAKTSLGSVLPEWAILFNASLLVLFSAFCFSAAVWRDMRPGHDTPQRSDLRPLPGPLLIVVNGGLLLVSVGALLGVWFGQTGGT
jgi:putative membrane protein